MRVQLRARISVKELTDSTSWFGAEIGQRGGVLPDGSARASSLGSLKNFYGGIWAGTRGRAARPVPYA